MALLTEHDELDITLTHDKRDIVVSTKAESEYDCSATAWMGFV